MALMYNGKMILHKELKKELKKEAKIKLKQDTIDNEIYYMSIYIIGTHKENYALFEGRVIEILDKEYRIKVKTRKNDEIFEKLVSKDRVRFTII